MVDPAALPLPRHKKPAFDLNSIALMGQDQDQGGEGFGGDGALEEVVAFSGKKKSSKKMNVGDIDDGIRAVVDDAVDGLEKSKKNKKGGGRANGFDKVLEEFGGKLPISASVSDVLIDEEREAVDLSGRKKSSFQRNGIIDDGNVVDRAKMMDDGCVVEGLNVKNKKNNKKKKSGKVDKEDEDFDKILEEFGCKQVPAAVADERIAVEEEEGGEDVVESAASKKKKRKEKDKVKKEAIAATTSSAAAVDDGNVNDGKKKISQRKVPAAVRKMQEEQARRKEAEEKKKAEEEEKRRKEEEEGLRLEEEERLREEERRRRKEREKEKKLRLKQEGKLLTEKQKEAKRKNDAWVSHVRGLQDAALPSADIVTKRPIYERKKSNPVPVKSTGKSCEVPEDELREGEPCIREIGESSSALSRVVENGDDREAKEDDEEWDSKNWDDVKVSSLKSPFDKEEEDPLGASASHGQIVNNNNRIAVTAKPTKVSEIVSSKETSVAKDVSEISSESLRSPICCILGHVDSGKTSLLDCIRGTNVQKREAGGITQQIGATYFPAGSIRERTKELKENAKLLIPGLLFIDTPGHASFTNLRSRGSGLCDIAILVVDLMSGLEKQTIESLNMLKMRNTEFIIALNKVDRLYQWKIFPNAPIIKSMKHQSPDVKSEFKWRLTEIMNKFMEEGVNTELYYRNKEMGQKISIVPTSALTGEGIPDLLLLMVQWTQKTMEKKLLFVDEVQCTILEVKADPGHGITIDVILVNGVLHEGDEIVLGGRQGPIVTTIRALLTPHPMMELRVQGKLCSHDQIKAAQVVKIVAQGLDHAIAGTALHVVKSDDDLEAFKDASVLDYNSVMNRIETSAYGVYVQASSLGSLEALTQFLKSAEVNIPISDSNFGPVQRNDVVKASLMLGKKKEYATILAFDVEVTSEARDLAEMNGVKIFSANVIYHLFDQFKAYMHKYKEEKKKEAAKEVVFPCVLKIRPDGIFHKKEPIVLGVDVLEGFVKVGTPICVPSRDFIDIGRIASMEINNRQVDIAKKGHNVSIKIVACNPQEHQKMYGRHFELADELVSHITRRSMDVLAMNFLEDLSSEEKKLASRLKKIFMHYGKF